MANTTRRKVEAVNVFVTILIKSKQSVLHKLLPTDGVDTRAADPTALAFTNAGLHSHHLNIICP